MISFVGSINKFEDSDAVGNKEIEILSKNDNTKVRIELPGKILFFDENTKDDINIMIDTVEIVKEDLKILIRGIVYTIDKKEESHLIQASLGGLPVMLEIKPSLNPFKPRSEFWIGLF